MITLAGIGITPIAGEYRDAIGNNRGRLGGRGVGGAQGRSGRIVVAFDIDRVGSRDGQSLGQNGLAIDQSDTRFGAAGLAAEVLHINSLNIPGRQKRADRIVSCVPGRQLRDIDFGGFYGLVFTLVKETQVGLNEVIHLAGGNDRGKIIH